MKKILILLTLLFAFTFVKAQVIITQPYSFKTWIKVKDSIRSAIYFQGATDTTATKKQLRDGLIAYGYKKSIVDSLLYLKQNKFVVNITDFGADSTGVVDATIPIQNAINSTVGGGIVFFPKGVYLTSGGIVVGSNITILGTGFGSIVKLMNNSNAEIFVIGSSTTTVTGVTFRDIAIDGNKANQTNLSYTGRIGRGIVSEGTSSFKHSNITIEHTYIHDCVSHGVYHEYGDNWIITNNFGFNNSNCAWEVGMGNNFNISNNIDSLSAYGIIINGVTSSSNNIINGNILISNGLADTTFNVGDGIHINDRVYKSVISNNTVINPRYAGINLHNKIIDCLVTGNVISNNNLVKDTCSGIFLDGYYGSCHNNTISNNTITGYNFNYGIWENTDNNSNIIQNNTIRKITIPYLTSGASTVITGIDSTGNFSSNSFSSTLFNSFMGGNTLSRNNSLTANYFQNLGIGNIVQFMNSGGVVGTISNTGVQTSPRFISNIPTGTQPFETTSSTVNINLNADLHDGYHIGTLTENSLLKKSGTSLVNSLISDDGTTVTIGGVGNITAPNNATWYGVGTLFIRSGTGAPLQLGSNNANSKVTINSDGTVSMSSTTASTTPLTGALKIAGGTGIAGDLSVGGNISGTSTTTSINSGRNLTSNTAGVDLSIKSNGATVGATDKSGGELYLTPGISTGNGTSTIRLQRYSRLPTSSTSDNTAMNALLIPSEKNLVNNTATSIFSIPLTSLGMAGGNISITINVTDGTDIQSYTGYISFSAVNKAGTYTTSIHYNGTPDIVMSNISTLVVTPSILTGTNIITIQVNANSSLTPTSMKCYYTLHNGSIYSPTQI